METKSFEELKVPTKIGLTVVQREWLRERAESTGSSMSGVVCYIIDLFMAEYDNKRREEKMAEQNDELARINRVAKAACEGRTDIEWVELTSVDQIGVIEPFRYVNEQSDGV